MGDQLDPQVREFVRQVSAEFASLGPLDGLTFPDARRVAERVRARWRSGGPQMQSTQEIRVPFANDGVRVRIYDSKKPAPASGPLRPALVYMHGGGWTLFSLDTHDRLMREYAARSGLIVIGVDYALSPEAKFPVALEQIVAVVRWLRGGGTAFGVDPDRLILGGDSAGGNLAMSAAVKLRDSAEGAGIAGILVNYGAFASECSAEAARRFGGEGFMLGVQELRQFWLNYLKSPADEQNFLASPIRAPLAGLPPVFLAIAECDVLCEQNLLMAERLRQAGVPTQAQVYSGASHSFLEAVSIAEISNRALDDAARWLAATTGLNATN